MGLFRKLFFKRISKLLVLVSLILFMGSLVWWQQTFGYNTDYLKCLASKTGICRVGMVGHVMGESVYNPALFWASVGTFITAVSFRLTRWL